MDQIEAAMTQVLRGMNGLTEWMTRNPSVISPRDEPARPFGVIPAVFTSAALFSSSVDLSTTDLETGHVAVGEDQLVRVPWLHFQYYQAPGLLNALPPAHLNKSLVAALHNDFARTVAVISPDGISDFLEKTSGILTGPWEDHPW